MAKTVVGLFDNVNEAQRVVQELVDRGFRRNDISLVANDKTGNFKQGQTSGGKGHNDQETAESAGKGAVGGTVVGGVLGLLVGVGALAIPGIGPVLAAGPLAAALGSTALGAGIGAAAGGLIGALTSAGVPEEDAHLYSEGVRRGGTLVMVKADDNTANDAYDIMQRYGAVDIDERGGQWRQQGWSGFDQNAQPYTSDEVDRYQTTSTANVPNQTMNTYDNTNYTRNQGDAVIPVVEEELQVGKRQVQRGGVRVYTHMEEIPVEEQVQLREEHVDVQRRPVNRPVSEADMAAFKEGSFEVTETAEEAVVSKQARVVEEVVIDKEMNERTETVRDSVRRTDVDVEQLGTERQNYTSGTDYTGTNRTDRNV